MMRPPSLSRPLCLLLKCFGMPVLGKFLTFSTVPSCRYRPNWTPSRTLSYLNGLPSDLTLASDFFYFSSIRSVS
jgi:hypothetical protein